jgi:hypothetical protein
MYTNIVPGTSANGTVTPGLGGTLIFEPTPGFTGVATFDYVVCEIPSGLCDTATVEVTVLPTGSPNTVLASDDYNTTVGVNTAIGNVLTNDVNPDGPQAALAVNPQNNVPVTGGIITILSNGNYSFTPTS